MKNISHIIETEKHLSHFYAICKECGEITKIFGSSNMQTAF
jgi:ribosomal protein S27E